MFFGQIFCWRDTKQSNCLKSLITENSNARFQNKTAAEKVITQKNMNNNTLQALLVASQQ